MKTYNVLSIDAWRSDCGWDWNNWFNAGDIAINIDASSRMIIKAMRTAGYLSDASKGRVAVDDDQSNLVIINKDTYEPLFAIEYGSTI